MEIFLNSKDIGAKGQKSLPASAWLCPAVFAEEQSRIFGRHWLCAARASELAEKGSYRVRELGNESVILVRDGNGLIRAHLNLCRHRGTRICESPSGRFAKTIQCPYHAWTYGLDGRLVGVPDENCLPGFVRDDFPLHTVACAEWEGFVWINLATDAEPFASVFDAVLSKFSSWNIGQLEVVGQTDYEVAANWKLIVQNYSECYHCANLHPGLVRLSSPRSGGNDLIEGPFLGGFLEVNDPEGSMSVSGRTCGLPVGEFSAAERRRVYYYVLFPQTLLSLHHDFVMVHTLWPLAPNRTRIECQWLFHPDTRNHPGLDPSDGIAFWDQTNREDWHVSELTQLGVASARYQPGPYSDREAMSAAFDRQYLRAMQEQ